MDILYWNMDMSIISGTKFQQASASMLMRRTSRRIILDGNTSQSLPPYKRCFQIVTVDRNRSTEVEQGS